jgi:hypothetical protein
MVFLPRDNVQQINPQQEAPVWSVGVACASLSVGASLMQIMHYGLWKSLPVVQHYLEHFDVISPDTSVWLFFLHIGLNNLVAWTIKTFEWQ